MKRLILISVLLISNANAGVVYNAKSAQSQVTLSRDANGVKSCGIRVLALAEVGAETRWYDFSGSVYRDGMFGLWKAGSYVFETKKLLKSVPSPAQTIRTPAPVGFWIAEAGNDVPVSMGKTTAAEDKGFTIGGGDFIRTMQSVMAVAKGDVAQFSTIYKSDKVETIISFSSPLSEADYSTLLDCLNGLQKGLEQDYGKLPKDPE